MLPRRYLSACLLSLLTIFTVLGTSRFGISISLATSKSDRLSFSTKLDSSQEDAPTVLRLLTHLVGHEFEKKTAENFYEQGYQQYEQGQYQAAIESWEKALSSPQDISEARWQENTLIMLGYVYLLLGKYQTSIEYSEKALDNAKKTQYFLGEAVALENLGSAYLATCKYEQPKEYFQQSLNIAQKHKYRKVEADVSGNLGNLYQALGDPIKAKALHEQNLKIARETGDTLGATNALGNIGSAYYALADYEKAGEYHEERRKEAQKIGDKQGEGKALGDLGSVYYRYGEYTQAIQHHQQHLEIAQEMDDLQGQVSALTNLGHDYNSLGQPIESLKRLEDALELAQKIGDCRNESNALNGIGLAFKELGTYSEAVQKFEQSLDIAERYQDVRGKGHVVGNLGTTYLAWGKQENNLEYYKKAIEYYQQKLEIVRDNNDLRSQGAVLTNLGVAHTKLGNYQAASDSFKQARKILQEIGDRDAEGKAIAGTAFLQEQQRETDRAIALYKDAIEIKESIRSKLMVESFKSTFADQQIDTYEQIIKLLWDRGDKKEAFNYVERARARTFLDQLASGKVNFRAKADPKLLKEEQDLKAERIAKREKLINLNNRPENEKDKEEIEKVQAELTAIEREYTNLLTKLQLDAPEAASLVSLKPEELLSWTEVQQALDKDTTLIEYFVTKERTYAFLINQNEFEAVTIEVKQEDLRDAIKKFRNAANDKDPYPDTLQWLYEQLIKQLPSNYFNSKSKLIIVPHSFLHYVPFAALTDGRDYLIDNYAIATLPSANVLQFLPNKTKPDIEEAFVLGDPVIKDLLPELRFAVEEAEFIAQLYKTKAYLKKQGTERILRVRAQDAHIVHIAAHGVYNNNSPLFSKLYLAADGQQPERDGYLEVYEIYGLNLEKANLVVLSACETNIGEISRGDEVVGLNRAFIYAGTPTVIASLWNVNDEATGLLMKQFYTNLRNGMNKSEALRQAQKSLRQEYPGPFYWAAFSLTGDGGR